MNFWSFLAVVLVANGAIWVYFDAVSLRDQRLIGIGPRGRSPERWAALVLVSLLTGLFVYFGARAEAQVAPHRRGAPPRYVTRGFESFGWIVGLLGVVLFAGLFALGRPRLALLGLVVVVAGWFGGRKTRETGEAQHVDLPSAAAWDVAGFVAPPPTEADADADEPPLLDLDQVAARRAAGAAAPPVAPPAASAPARPRAPAVTAESLRDLAIFSPPKAGTPGFVPPARSAPKPPASASPTASAAPASPTALTAGPAGPAGPAAPAAQAAPRAPTRTGSGASDDVIDLHALLGLSDEAAGSTAPKTPPPASAPAAAPAAAPPAAAVPTPPATPVAPATPPPAATPPARPVHLDARPAERQLRPPSPPQRSTPPAAPAPVAPGSAAAPPRPKTSVPGAPTPVPGAPTPAPAARPARPARPTRPAVPPSSGLAEIFVPPEPGAAAGSPASAAKRPAKRATPPPKRRGGPPLVVWLVLGAVLLVAFAALWPWVQEQLEPTKGLDTARIGAPAGLPDGAAGGDTPSEAPSEAPSGATAVAGEAGDSTRSAVPPATEDTMRVWAEHYREVVGPMAELLEEIDFSSLEPMICRDFESSTGRVRRALRPAPDAEIETLLRPALGDFSRAADACKDGEEEIWSLHVLNGKKGTHEAQRILADRWSEEGLSGLELEGATGFERSPASITGRYLAARP